MAWLPQECLEKTGADLFKELLRFFPLADYEDYFKNSVWKEDLLRLDLQLVAAHKLSAGAPDPEDFDKVKVDLPLPALRPPVAPLPAGAGSVGGALKPNMPLKAAAALKPASPGVLTPGAVTATTTATPGGASTVATGVQELRLIAMLVTKWKLEPTKTKQMLAALSPARRHAVIQNFKTDAAAGLPATEALEAYIKAESEKDPPAEATAAAAEGKAGGIALATVPGKAGAPGAKAGTDAVPATAKTGPLTPGPVLKVSNSNSIAAPATTGSTPAPAATSPGTSPVASGVAELRLIALLITKWKLDPIRTKTLLASLPAPKRHSVIQNFTTDAAAGAPATDALEAYIKTVAPTPPATGKAGVTPAAAGWSVAATGGGPPAKMGAAMKRPRLYY